jgi:dihydroxy-acid dehydratase
LGIDESTLLVIRGCGPVGFPGSAEVVNMLPPDALVRRGINELPTLGDGRQSGTSASPSILNASPEAAAGGGLARLRTGDRVRIDLNLRRVDALVPEAEWRRRDPIAPPVPATRTPWEHLYRQNVGQLATGACLECALAYRCATAPVARHNH